jgi:hypothetical protein
MFLTPESSPPAERTIQFDPREVELRPAFLLPVLTHFGSRLAVAATALSKSNRLAMRNMMRIFLRSGAGLVERHTW